VGQMQQEVNFAISQTAGYKKRPRVLVLEFLGKEPTVYGEKSLAGNIVKELHGELLAEKQRSIGFEQVVELDPDVIFVVVIESHYGHEQDMVDRVTKHKALKNLRCVQQGRVIPLPFYGIYSSGVRTYDGIKIIAAGMYPDLYKEK
ncbi:ABC transporter substrate-binding protein, partial [Phascolarctobacterium succinatutens]